MREYLIEANQDLLHQIDVAREMIGRVSVSGELTPYVGQVMQICAGLRQQALRNLKDLEYPLDDTLPDILAATQRLTEAFELVNVRLANPIVRAKPEDRLALLLLRWLHDTHPETALLPFGLTDGSFGVYPTSQIPPVYYVPVTRQKTILYLSLFFHEFGHVLYTGHKLEMKDLVEEFQKVVKTALTPRSVRGRSSSSQGASFRRKVVPAWFAWVQEFFCDAVGLTIGGPSYLKAFSHYFRTWSNDQYYIPRDEQLKSRHPVTWLRIKMLADRARKHQHTQLADTVVQAWAETAQVIGIQEDYEGTWLEDFLIPLRQTLDDMIEEAQPYEHRPQDVTPPDQAANLNPVQVCNCAWNQFEANPSTYRAWERETIERFLKSN